MPASGSRISCRPCDDRPRGRRPPSRARVRGADRPGPGRAHGVPGHLGAVALAPATHPDLRRVALRRIRELRLPRGRSAVLERRAHDRGVHARLGGARGRAGRGGRARDPRPAGRAAHGHLAAAPRVGDARRRGREALRVALSSRGRAHQRGARPARDQLARRSRRGAAGRHPGRRVAHDAVRGDPLLRAAPGDPGRRVRGRAGRRRRPARDLDADHPAAARADPAAGGAVPHPGRAARLRHHVRADRRRPGRDDRDAHGLRVPGALPDPAAGLRLGGERDRLRPGHGRRVGVLETPSHGYGRRMKARMRTLADVAVVLALAAYAIPFFWQLLTSFKPEAELLRVPPLLPSRLTLAHYQVVISQSLIPRALGNSLGIATLTTLVSLAAGVPAAYAVARLPLPGKRLLLLAIVASTAFPQIATVSPLYLLMRALELRDTWAGLVLVHASFALPLTIWLLAGFVREIPIEAEEAASVDGAGLVAMLRWVLLPLLAPGLASTALLTFLFSWNEFLFAYTFTVSEASRTIPVALALFPGVFEVPWGDIAAASMLASLPPVVIVIALQRFLVQGLVAGAVKE